MQDVKLAITIPLKALSPLVELIEESGGTAEIVGQVAAPKRKSSSGKKKRKTFVTEALVLRVDELHKKYPRWTNVRIGESCDLAGSTVGQILNGSYAHLVITPKPKPSDQEHSGFPVKTNGAAKPPQGQKGKRVDAEMVKAVKACRRTHATWSLKKLGEHFKIHPNTASKILAGNYNELK